MKFFPIIILSILCLNCSLEKKSNQQVEEFKKNTKIESQKTVNYTDSIFMDIDKALEHKDLVTELSLRNRNLDKFPMEILELSNLEKLDLSLNKIDSIPVV